MAEKTRLDPTHKSTNKAKPRKTVTKHGVRKKQQVEHAYKLSIMRECQIYGKSYEECKMYFESKGFTLGESQFFELRKELKSADNAREWFSKEALFVIEDDHMLSVQRIRMMEDRLLKEFEQVAATNFYKYLNAGSEEQEIIRNKAHDGHFLLRIIGEFRALQEIKTKMFSATPLVQELMEVHRRQDVEQNAPPPVKTEKVVNNV